MVASGDELARRSATEQRLSLLVRELEHRIKNSLATVQALAQDPHGSRSRDEDRQGLFLQLTEATQGDDNARPHSVGRAGRPFRRRRHLPHRSHELIAAVTVERLAEIGDLSSVARVLDVSAATLPWSQGR